MMMVVVGFDLFFLCLLWVSMAFALHKDRQTAIPPAMFGGVFIGLSGSILMSICTMILPEMLIIVRVLWEVGVVVALVCSVVIGREVIYLEHKEITHAPEIATASALCLAVTGGLGISNALLILEMLFPRSGGIIS